MDILSYPFFKFFVIERSDMIGNQFAMIEQEQPRNGRNFVVDGQFFLFVVIDIDDLDTPFHCL